MKIKEAKYIHQIIVEVLVEKRLIPDKSHFKEVNLTITPKDLSINVDYEEQSLDIRNI